MDDSGSDISIEEVYRKNAIKCVLDCVNTVFTVYTAEEECQITDSVTNLKQAYRDIIQLGHEFETNRKALREATKQLSAHVQDKDFDLDVEQFFNKVRTSMDSCSSPVVDTKEVDDAIRLAKQRRLSGCGQ